MKAAEKVVAYFYDEEIGNYCYGGGNPMRPHRARMCYSLVDSYGLTKKMMVQRPRPREFEELTQFHADDYINFLRGVTPNTVDENMMQLRRFNMGIAGEADCPVFDGLYEYCQVYSGGSVDGAAQLASGAAQLAFNWSGGMHHAKKAEASGFCYVNDIVMAILELLKTYARVLYVDIDIHHGDGVEEAFYLTDRVMTVSFHKYGEFFPGTGALDDIGYGKGKYYTVNVPLKDGMDDDSYRLLYEPIMQKVMELFQPGAIVMCCGADSLSGDRLGCFNLSIEGHSNCLEFLAKFNVPILILGGGGYTLRNVARCWCYETGRMMNIDLPDGLPDKALDEFNMYLDTQRLRIAVSNMKNANERMELEQIKTAVLEHLSQLPPAPSAPMAYVPPRMGRDRPTDGLPEEDPDARGGGQAHEEVRRVRDGDESDAEEGSGRGGYGDNPSSLAGGRVYMRYNADGETCIKSEPQDEPSRPSGPVPHDPPTAATAATTPGPPPEDVKPVIVPAPAQPPPPPPSQPQPPAPNGGGCSGGPDLLSSFQAAAQAHTFRQLLAQQLQQQQQQPDASKAALLAELEAGPQQHAVVAAARAEMEARLAAAAQGGYGSAAAAAVAAAAAAAAGEGAVGGLDLRGLTAADYASMPAMLARLVAMQQKMGQEAVRCQLPPGFPAGFPPALAAGFNLTVADAKAMAGAAAAVGDGGATADGAAGGSGGGAVRGEGPAGGGAGAGHPGPQ